MPIEHLVGKFQHPHVLHISPFPSRFVAVSWPFRGRLVLRWAEALLSGPLFVHHQLDQRHDAIPGASNRCFGENMRQRKEENQENFEKM